MLQSDIDLTKIVFSDESRFGQNIWMNRDEIKDDVYYDKTNMT